jgi:hypothetical protein
MKHRTVVISLVAVAAVAAGTLASAAQLNVSTPKVDALSDAPCTRATINVNGTNNTGANYAGIEISDMPVACAGQTLDFVLFDISHNQLATGTGTIYSGGAPGSPTAETFATTSTFKDSDVAGIAVLADTWGIPASYAGAPPVTPAVSCIPYSNGGNPQPSKSCTVAVSYDTPYDAGAAGQFSGFTVNVSSTAQSWRLVIDFTQSDFPFNPEWLGQSFQTAAIDGTCSSPIGTITLQPANGQLWGGYFNFSSVQAPSWWSGTTICP